MLIYDYNKKFLGIDEDDLKHLGFSSGSALFELCDNFADLFVKRPGYIHNFKNFEWIDFVMHADAEVAKAIIHTPTRNYSCKLQIKPFYLIGTQGKTGYQVFLQGLKALSSDEDAQIAPDLKMHVTPSVSPKSAPPTYVRQEPKAISPSDINLPDFSNAVGMELNEPDIFDVPFSEQPLQPYGAPIAALEETKPARLDIGDIYVPMETPSEFEFSNEFTPPYNMVENTVPEPTIEVPPKRSNLPDIPMLGDRLSAEDRLFIDNLHVTSDYCYNPNIAAQELGLPVDLIEEFIGDFIQQSHDFHEPLFSALEQRDIESIKTLSHKLKGVAANLRIEDSFEVLSIINTSKDIDELSANLKYFYHLIAKLEGKEIPTEYSETFTEELHHDAPSPHTLVDTFTSPTFTAEVPMQYFSETVEAPVVSQPVDFSYDNIQIKAAPSSDLYAPLTSIQQPYSEYEPPLIRDLPPLQNAQPEQALHVQAQEYFPTIIEPVLVEPKMVLENDMQKCAQEIGLPYEAITELFGEFRIDALRAERLLQEAVAAFEPQEWQKPARLLKGMSDNLRLQQISKELQILSQTNDAQKAKVALQNYSGLIAQL